MYLAYLSHAYVTKNKLEEGFYQYLKSIDRTLIGDSEIGKFKKEILLKYDELCKQHSRCKPIAKRYYSQGKDISLHGSNAIFRILKAK